MVEVKLHDIGEGMTEAEITSFLVKPGDVVNADDPLVEVQTDKMTAEIPAPKSGIVKEFTVREGETVAVGTTLLVMEIEGSVKPTKKFIIAAPHTRKIARELKVNIEDIIGSGPSGRITDQDVYQFAEKMNDTKQPTPPRTAPIEIDHAESEIIPFRSRRKEIAKRMARSVYTIPHCTHFEEVDVTNLIGFRGDLKAINQNISATAFFIKALSIGLKKFPIFNSELDEENEVIKLKHGHHIGVATDTKDGLIVPVIRHVEQKSIKQIHEEMKALTQKAVENKLSVREITGGTFTISNVGPLGGSIGATPIIHHPEVALMSFHKTKKIPVVNENDEIVIRSIMNISMSFDHRVTDGATAVAFTNHFSNLISNPKLMLIDMI